MRLLSIAVLSICAAHAQSYTLQVAAGGGPPENIPCTAAVVYDGIGGLAADGAGNLYIPISSENVVVRCEAATGMLTRVAGTGAAGFSDGQNVPATSVRVTSPVAVAVAGDGSVYIAEPARVRKISHGIISTVAGNGIAGFRGDGGPATEAEISPQAIAVDASGNVYIAGSGRVREVSGGMIRTVAGAAPGTGTTADNVPATSVAINPVGVAVDSAGNLYIANLQRGVRKVSNGIITTVTGAVKAYAVAVDASGNLYIADSSAVYEFSGGTLTRISPVDVAAFVTGSLAVDAAGNVYYPESYADYFNSIPVSRVRKVSHGVVTTVVAGGTGAAGYSNPTAAQLGLPGRVAVANTGNVYFSDSQANRIWKLSNGVLTAVAGNGGFGFSGDGGLATDAQLASPTGIAVDAQGALYIADRYNHRVRKVVNGVITTVAGNGGEGDGGDGGSAVNAQLFRPTSVAADAAGTLYIADEQSNRVRRVSNGIITAAACDGAYGYVGENVPATSAQCKYPGALAVDGAGNLYFADTFNGYVRKVAPNGIIHTIAGIGHTPGDGIPAVDAEVAPIALAVDAAGSVYIGGGGTIRKVVNGVIHTIAGGGLADGLAPSTALGSVAGIAVDSAGRIWFSDTVSRTIRLLTPQSVTPVSIASVRNAASNLESWIAPGEIVVLTGSGLGPADLTMGKLTVDGVYDTQIAGSSVQINGVPAPMVYASAGQVAAVVPYHAIGAGALLNQITVTYQGSVSQPMKVAGAPWLLGLFTADGSGRGQAAAVNQNGALNDISHPAARGSIISLYATGEGVTAPGGIDGKPASAPLPMPTTPVSVTIGGQTVPNVEYAGSAPGEIAGLMQINLRIPENVASGNAVTVTVQAGYSISQPGVTIVVGK